MLTISRCARRLWNDNSGATAIEYALFAALIAGAIIVAVTVLGGTVQALYLDVSTRLSAM